jgi:hypothetical protein
MSSDQASLPLSAPWPLSELVSFWHGTSAASATLVALLLLAAAAWLGRRALPLYRALRAIRTAPLVKVASGQDGLVKVAGRAYPGLDPPPGLALPDDVWHVGFQMSSTSANRGTRTYSVGMMLLRDDSGECLVDPKLARVFHSTVDSHSSRFFDSFQIRTDHRIRTGDEVFAIGVLGKAQRRPGRGDLPRCTLRPSNDGVLVYSGQGEPSVRRRLRARYWPMAGAALVLALVGLWGLRTHMLTYDTDAAFVSTLFTRPWDTVWERRPPPPDDEGHPDQRPPPDR